MQYGKEMIIQIKLDLTVPTMQKKKNKYVGIVNPK